MAGVDAPAAQAMGTSSLAFWQSLLVDVAFWVAVYGGRAYTREPVSGRMPHHFCVAHYIAVLTVTDVVFFVCPPTRRHWFHPFRVTGALQVAGLVLQLLHNGNGVDGTTWWSALRLLACVVRAADGVLGMWRSGLLGFSWPQLVPTSTTAEPPGAALRAWISLAAFCPTVPGPVTFELLTALIFLSFPAVASSTHYNLGESRIDAPLAGFQAGDALNAFVKVFVFERLIGGATSAALRRRAWVHLLLGASLLVQWPYVPELISMAARPYAHVVAEFGCLLNGAVRLWWAFCLPA